MMSSSKEEERQRQQQQQQKQQDLDSILDAALDELLEEDSNGEDDNDSNASALPNPPSTPSKVFEQLVEAKNIHSQNTTSMELAPPSAPSPSSNKSPANNYNNNGGALSSSSSVAAAQQQSTLPISPNGKLFSHVERAENNNNNNNNNPLPSIMKKEQQQSPTPSSSPSAMMQDTVERIANAVENREASSRESALANGYSQQQQQQIMEVTHGGQFTSTELSQLSLLCTSGFSTVTNNSNNNNNNGGMKQQSYYQSSQWASIDGDLLSSLTPMLRAHVTSAMRVDLIGEGVGVIANTIKAESSPEKKTGPVITIHQVRRGGQIYWKLQCRILFNNH